MRARVKDLLHIKNDEAVDGLMKGIGVTTPTDGDPGWMGGATFLNSTNGYVYYNEGSITSCDFNKSDTLTVAQIALLDVTAGTAEASKVLTADANIDIDTLRNVGLTGDLTVGGDAAVTGAITAASLVVASLSNTPVARTATTTGATTGTIADAGVFQHVNVTSDSAAKIIILPTPTPGTIVVLAVTSTGYELRSSAPSTVLIGGGTGGAAVESAIPADSVAVLYCTSATSWLGFTITGTTLAAVEAAA